jgi:hypothetical protein
MALCLERPGNASMGARIVPDDHEYRHWLPSLLKLMVIDRRDGLAG